MLNIWNLYRKIVLNFLVFSHLFESLTCKITVTTSRNDTYIFTDQQAAFGPLFPLHGLQGSLSLASPENGCTPFRLSQMTVNTTFTKQWVALMIRGECHFHEKIRHAQQAGASAAIVFDDQVGPLFTMFGFLNDVQDIMIPSVSIRRPEGNLLKDFLSTALSQKPSKGVVTVSIESEYFGNWTAFVLPFAIVIIISIVLVS
eukprot:Sdes_comp24119_c0_seq1m22161